MSTLLGFGGVSVSGESRLEILDEEKTDGTEIRIYGGTGRISTPSLLPNFGIPGWYNGITLLDRCARPLFHSPILHHPVKHPRFPSFTVCFKLGDEFVYLWSIFNLGPFGLPSLDYPELCSGPAISGVFWPVPGRGMVQWTACIFLCLSVPHRTPRSSTMVSVAAYPNTAR